MAFLSPEYLKRYAHLDEADKRYVARTKVAGQMLLEGVTSGVFLSHSTADDHHIPKIIMFFRDHGAIAYADNYDESLPQPPSPETAAKLKERITACRHFVVLVSANSSGSRWIPWELGYADGTKRTSRIATLPLTDQGVESGWAKQEYFGLYPRIYQEGGEWRVFDPSDGQYWKLKKWLEL